MFGSHVLKAGRRKRNGTACSLYCTYRKVRSSVKRGSKILCVLLSAYCSLLHSEARAFQTTVKPSVEAATELPKLLTARQQRLTEALDAVHIKLDIKERSLADVVNVLAERLHCGIMVDDEPLLTKADLKFDGTGKDALDKVMDAFDYTWEVSKSGGVLMRKRFRNPVEHPQMNYAELRQMARDAVTILDTLHFNPQTYQETWPYILRELYESFTLEQRVIMTDETKSLTMPQLAPEQRALVEKAIYCSMFQEQIRAWNAFAAQLDALPQSWMQRETALAAIKIGDTASGQPVLSTGALLNLHLPLRGGRSRTVNLAAAAVGSAGRSAEGRRP